jgi:hypothetical protein
MKLTMKVKVMIMLIIAASVCHRHVSELLIGGAM